MSRLFRRTNIVFLAVFGLLLAGAVALAQHGATITRIFAGPPNTVALTNERAVTAEAASNRPLIRLDLAAAIERDNKTIPVEVGGSVSPGEVVNFTLSSVNEGSAPAREYRAVGQIPPGTTFVAGSAAPGDTAIQVRYSIDGGQEFSSIPTIDDKQTDGTIKKVQAPVSMYTQVRFEWADALAPGGKLAASYQVRLK